MYAKIVANTNGERYALFKGGKFYRYSIMRGTNEEHKKKLRTLGYRIRKGYVREESPKTMLQKAARRFWR